MNSYCFACKKNRVLTNEHIIPQAIGGRLKAKIYCKECNSTFGNKLDTEVEKEYGFINTLLNIKRERDSKYDVPKPFEVKDLESGTKLNFDGKSFTRKKPIVNKKFINGKQVPADVTARSKKELNKIISSINDKHRLTGEWKSFIDSHPVHTYISRETVIDNALLRRAVSKIAYGFLCTKLTKNVILSSSFDAIRDYIDNGRGPYLAHANYIHTTFMTDYIRPLHKIHVALNRHEGLVIGYVSIFGTFRFTVLLAEGFKSILEWSDFDYTFDPVLRKKVPVPSNFRVRRLTKEEILKPKQSKEFIQRELDKSYEAFTSYVDDSKYKGSELFLPFDV